MNNSEIFDYVKRIREELHRCPETEFNEFETTKIIRRELDSLGIEYKTCTETGTLAIISGEKSGKTVLLRADIDALPIKEETDLPFKSQNTGYMHACGHDVHTACLLGAAKILNEIKEQIQGNVKLAFQPAEEGSGGAKLMIDEGALENPTVDAAFAMHVEPLEKVGNIQIKNGAIMACPDEFTIHISGIGGHGSAPQQCVDPIAISAAIIAEYQTIVRKSVNPMIPCVVSVCSIHSGSCPNVIPSEAVMEGTVRALDNETRFKIADILKKRACCIAEMMGGKCSFEYRALYPPVVNDEKMNEIVARAAGKLGLGIVNLPFAAMAGDDFSYFGEKVPAAYFKLGVGNNKLHYPIHSPKFNADEQAYENGSKIMAQIALEYLNS